MSKGEERLVLTDHDLGDGCLFRSGRLQNEHRWGPQIFERVWDLRPAERHKIMIHGHEVAIPRLQEAYMADYQFSGTTKRAKPLPVLLQPLYDWVKEACYVGVGGTLGILGNWYEGPGQYIGPHHDKYKDLVSGSPIVTVSFGETRTFRLTKGKGTDARVFDFPATDGAVFVLPFETNRIWKHSVPKSTKYKGRRISMTFRAFAAVVTS
jgi:alkylated DNA repair dioxygenase AlkB